MKLCSDKSKRILALALSLAIGFVGGIATKDMVDAKNSARASQGNAVPVEKVKDPALSNRLIRPDLWDIYVDPFVLPTAWRMAPLPLTPLISFAADTPKVQTVNGDKDLCVVAQVPGMSDKAVKVEAAEHMVTIKAHKKQENKGGLGFQSFDEVFEQSVHLPCKVNADKVQASVKDGVLTVTLPKA